MSISHYNYSCAENTGGSAGDAQIKSASASLAYAFGGAPLAIDP